MQLKSTERTYLGLAVSTSLLSMVGCFVIIFSFWYLRDQRTLAKKILVFISFANLLSSLGTLLSSALVLKLHKLDWYSHPVCESAATVSIIGNISSYLWTCLLAVHLYISLNWKKYTMAKAVMVPALVICWGFPIAITVSALVSEAIGADNGQSFKQQAMSLGPVQLRPPWCLVASIIDDYVTWSFLTGMGWRMGSTIVCTIAYLLVQLDVIRKSARTPRTNEEEEETDQPDEIEAENRKQLLITKSNRQLRHVLVIAILINIWGIWRFLIENYIPVAAPAGIVVMQVIGDNIQGFANAVLLCVFNKDIRQKVCKICRCTYKKFQDTSLKEMEHLREQDQDQRNLLMNIATTEDEEVQFSRE